MLYNITLGYQGSEEESDEEGSDGVQDEGQSDGSGEGDDEWESDVENGGGSGEEEGSDKNAEDIPGGGAQACEVDGGDSNSSGLSSHDDEEFEEYYVPQRDVEIVGEHARDGDDNGVDEPQVSHNETGLGTPGTLVQHDRRTTPPPPPTTPDSLPSSALGKLSATRYAAREHTPSQLSTETTKYVPRQLLSTPSRAARSPRVKQSQSKSPSTPRSARDQDGGKSQAVCVLVKPTANAQMSLRERLELNAASMIHLATQVMLWMLANPGKTFGGVLTTCAIAKAIRDGDPFRFHALIRDWIRENPEYTWLTDSEPKMIAGCLLGAMKVFGRQVRAVIVNQPVRPRPVSKRAPEAIQALKDAAEDREDLGRDGGRRC
nr:hypothetical protein B0A51_10874 [Rachicladosporium sp. CCFEE 5018]